MPEHGAIEVKVIPRSSKSHITLQDDGTVKINLKSPPVDGKANKECIALLSKKLGVPKSSVHIVSGEKGRNKRIRVDGIPVAEILKTLVKD